MSEKICFLGLGNMGRPMAGNLLKHGINLFVYNRSVEKMQPLLKAGAHAINNPSEAFQKAPIVFSMLANDEALIAVSDELLKGARKDCIHVSLSTVSPETIKKLNLKHQAKGVSFISATVFGRPDAAEKQKLWICAAGESQAKEKVKPYLEMIGQKVYDFGGVPETANIVKISGNFMILSTIEMLSEAFAVLEKNGIDKDVFLKLMTETLFPSPVFQGYGNVISKEQFSPAGFHMPLGLKDLGLFLSLNEKACLDLPLTTLLKQRLNEAIQEGLGDKDWSAISLLSKRTTTHKDAHNHQ